MSNFKIKPAKREDTPIILNFIKAIAEYEKMSEQVVVTENELEKELFDNNSANVIIGYEDDKPVAFMLYYYNFSTFLGKRGIYLEDIFIFDECRGKGYGKKMIRQLARIAKKENAGRIEWRCLKWNTPSLAFYKSLNAIKLDDWVSLNLEKEQIENLAK